MHYGGNIKMEEYQEIKTPKYPMISEYDKELTLKKTRSL